MTYPALQLRTARIMDSFSAYLVLCLAGVLASWAVWELVGHDRWEVPAVGLVFCLVCCLRARNRVVSYRKHRLSMLGEQVVGQILDRLNDGNTRVFHDMEVSEPGTHPWNIDHVVLTPGGVFTIETKTRGKHVENHPGGQQPHTVTFDGERLVFPPPFGASRRAVKQADLNATWLATKLSALNGGTPIAVTPVLVLPGWSVDSTGEGTVAVFNPKHLPAFLSNRPVLISGETLEAIALQLDERCRIDLARRGS